MIGDMTWYETGDNQIKIKNEQNGGQPCGMSEV